MSSFGRMASLVIAVAAVAAAYLVATGSTKLLE